MWSGLYQKREIMKKIIITSASLLLASALFTSCNKGELSTEPVDSVALLSVNTSSGISTIETKAEAAVFGVTGDLTADEIEFLYAVREDEKLARDVYTLSFNKYSIKTFDNIANAESRHISAVDTLFDYYEIEYPPLSDYGVFEDSIRQTLYDSLTAAGTSALEAFKVMAWIEESSIYYYGDVLKSDLNPNIEIVIENLEKASENHLKAAIRQITALGGTYSPKFLSGEEFDRIVAKGFVLGKRYMYKNKEMKSNAGNPLSMNKNSRGAVNKNGTAIAASSGSVPGKQSSPGNIGKGYRGGK